MFLRQPKTRGLESFSSEDLALELRKRRRVEATKQLKLVPGLIGIKIQAPPFCRIPELVSNYGNGYEIVAIERARKNILSGEYDKYLDFGNVSPIPLFLI